MQLRDAEDIANIVDAGSNASSWAVRLQSDKKIHTQSNWAWNLKGS